jgi:hypothetical protein
VRLDLARMTGVTPLLGAALIAMLPAPAAAADVAQLGCPIEALSAGDRANLADHVRRQAQASEPAMQAFYGTVETCRSRHRWSMDAAREAVVYNLASIGAGEARRALEQRGIDMATIERALLADRAVIASARTDQGPDVIAAFYERLDPALRQRIESGPDAGGSAELLGTYILFRSAVETSRAEFAAR